MKMKIEFEMDNAAFENEPATELDRIFSDIIERAGGRNETGRGISDGNGNRIGQWIIEE